MLGFLPHVQYSHDTILVTNQTKDQLETMQSSFKVNMKSKSMLFAQFWIVCSLTLICTDENNWKSFGENAVNAIKLSRV